jgi:hypothetical protein
VSPVQISSGSDRRNYEHALSLRGIKQRRLHHLQVKESRLGATCDVSVPMEIEDLRAEIAALDAQVAAYARVPTHISPLLSGEQQRQALLALAAIVGVAPERITLVDIVLGSIVLVIDLPLPEAARLLALQRLLPQALERAGFASVAHDPASPPVGPLLARTVADAEAMLTAPAGPTDGPMVPEPSVPAVRLRVTLVAGQG